MPQGNRPENYTQALVNLTAVAREVFGGGDGYRTEDLATVARRLDAEGSTFAEPPAASDMVDWNGETDAAG